jgi:hypothetical protein
LDHLIGCLLFVVACDKAGKATKAFGVDSFVDLVPVSSNKWFSFRHLSFGVGVSRRFKSLFFRHVVGRGRGSHVGQQVTNFSFLFPWSRDFVRA